MFLNGCTPLLLILFYLILNKYSSKVYDFAPKQAKMWSYGGLGIAIIITNIPTIIGLKEATIDTVISLYFATMCIIETIDIYFDAKNGKKDSKSSNLQTNVN